MDVVNCRRWVLQVDREATLQAYAATAAAGSDECKCAYCRNFAAAREQVYPAEFLALLTRLGIDYRKDAEVWEVSPDNSRMRFYSGLFHFIGSIVSSDERGQPRKVALEHTGTTLAGGEELIGGSFAFTFADRADLVHPSFEGYHVVQLEFAAEVPWVLDEPPDN